MNDLESITRMLRSELNKLVGVSGLLVSGYDGRPVAHQLEEQAIEPTSAISAASLQLARRLADLLGDGPLEEITVRSTDGYVIVNSIGEHWVLTALTNRSANVAMINLAFRDLVPKLEDRLLAL